MQCCNRPLRKHGRDSFGYQRYLCPVCNKTVSDNPGQTRGQPKKADAMSMAQRQRNCRARKRQQNN